MEKFDPKIFEKLTVAIASSKELLEIEQWKNFELDFSTPTENKNEIYQLIKNSIKNYNSLTGIYAIFDGEKCLYIGKGKRIWERIKCHYNAAKGLDKEVRWTEFFKQYQKKVRVYWIEYRKLEDAILDDKLRELFEHILQVKYDPAFEKFKYY